VDWAERGVGEKIQDSGIQGYRDTRIQIHMHRDTGYWILEQAT